MARHTRIQHDWLAHETNGRESIGIHAISMRACRRAGQFELRSRPAGFAGEARTAALRARRRSSGGTRKATLPRSTHPGRPGTHSHRSFAQPSVGASKCGQKKLIAPRNPHRVGTARTKRARPESGCCFLPATSFPRAGMVWARAALTFRKFRALSFIACGQLAQLVRARASHARGHWFEPSIAHQPDHACRSYHPVRAFERFVLLEERRIGVRCGRVGVNLERGVAHDEGLGED